MFTGIVTGVARVSLREGRDRGVRFGFSWSGTSSGEGLAPPWSALDLGESIAVNGVCLTVTSARKDGFHADASEETLGVTTLGSLGAGARVNLERALRAHDLLGGHLMTGHVDGVGEVIALEARGDCRRVALGVPEALMRFLAPKGSIAVDGVSLTINRTAEASIEVMLIPHTLSHTTLGALAPGSQLNLEVDPLARYAVHYLEATLPRASAETPAGAARDGRLLSALENAGFLSPGSLPRA